MQDRVIVGVVEEEELHRVVGERLEGVNMRTVGSAMVCTLESGLWKSSGPAFLFPYREM